MDGKTLRKHARTYPFVLVFLFFFAVPVLGSEGGSPMPWDTALESIGSNVTTTVARWGVIIATVVAALSWAWSQHQGEGGSKATRVIFGGSVAVGAVSFLAALGISGALL